MIFLQQTTPYTVQALLWLVLPGVISGAVAVIVSLAIFKRFLRSEYPGFVNSVERKLGSMDAHLTSIETSVNELKVLFTRQEGRIDHHDWRLRQMERERGIKSEDRQ